MMSDEVGETQPVALLCPHLGKNAVHLVLNRRVTLSFSNENNGLPSILHFFCIVA